MILLKKNFFLLIILVIIILLNLLSFNYYLLIDLSRSQEFRLSLQTRQLLRTIQGKLDIIIYYSPQKNIIENLFIRDVKNFLDELVFSGKPKVRVNFVDPLKDFNMARELHERLGLDPYDAYFILSYENKYKYVKLIDLVEINLSNTMIGDLPKVSKFLGEQQFVKLMLSLLDSKEKKIYFTQGHGEPIVENQLSLLLSYLKKQDIKYSTINLNAIESIPTDASVIILIGLKNDITEYEFEIIKNYLLSNGRLLVLLNPDYFYSTPNSSPNQKNIKKILNHFGLIPENNRIIRLFNLNFLFGIYRDVVAEIYGDSEISKRLKNLNIFLPSPVLSIIEDKSLIINIDCKNNPLLIASEPYWGESDYIYDNNNGVKYDEGIDRGYPIFLGYASQKTNYNTDNNSKNESRLVLIGNHNFVYDIYLQQNPNTSFNLDFIISCINWLIDRDRFTGVIPKDLSEFKFILSNSQLSLLTSIIFILFPLFVVLSGIIVYYKRKNR